MPVQVYPPQRYTSRQVPVSAWLYAYIRLLTYTSSHSHHRSTHRRGRIGGASHRCSQPPQPSRRRPTYPSSQTGTSCISRTWKTTSTTYSYTLSRRSQWRSSPTRFRTHRLTHLLPAVHLACTDLLLQFCSGWSLAAACCTIEGERSGGEAAHQSRGGRQCFDVSHIIHLSSIY